MNIKQKLIARCKELNVTLLDCGDCLRIDAPAKKLLASNGIHFFDLYLRDWKRQDAYLELLRELSYGLEDCTISNCECCEENLQTNELEKLYDGERLA